ncbi:MAG: hypothetical protein SOZ34_03395 [Clostridia bacterium]|nr:hypothetical protein [Clostridia bacterium]
MYLAPIVTYPVLAILLPVIFFIFIRKYMWLSILLAVIIEVIVYWIDFCYYEARGLMICITIAQVIVMTIIIFILKVMDRKLKK